MSRTRSLEIWHIPKRKNVHQMIGAVEILLQEEFNGKSWTGGKKESFNTELKKAGLTQTGRVLAQSGRRTLEALLKYLGFVFVNNETTPPTIYVTNAGKELIKKHGSVLGKQNNFRLVQRKKEEILESPLVKYQMTKLQITNPVIREDCINILLFPFRITLKLLVDLEYLTDEELGYIVFSMRSEDEFKLITEKIKTFRQLDSDRRVAEIEAFKGTEIGNLTLVQAPTASYYMGLCVGTGLCRKNGNRLTIRNEENEEAHEIIDKFKDVKPFNFENNVKLWVEYFGDIKRLMPPLLVSIKLKNSESCFIKIYDTSGSVVSETVLSDIKLEALVPLFKHEQYKFEFFSFTDASKIHEKLIEIDSDKIVFDIGVKLPGLVSTWDIESIIRRIRELIGGRDFDSEYSKHLENVKKITGKSSFNISLLRGGRLEYLFFKLLLSLKDRKVIDDVIWNGRLDDFGIAYPALGGKEGNPDLHYYIGSKLFVLELTTIRGNAMQWSAEAASVHDHINNLLKKVGGNYQVTGIFSAPIISTRVEEMYRHISSKENILHRTIDIETLIKILMKENRDEINNLST